MGINRRLLNLYEHHWPELVYYGKMLTDPMPANPLLLRIDEHTYSHSDIKVVICGQETWGWTTFGENIVTTADAYWHFFVCEKFYKGHRRSSFWKAFSYFKRRLAEEYPNSRISIVWQNLSKIGRNDGVTGVTTAIRTLEREHFPVFLEEMRILSPNIVLFLTGPSRDHDILFHFPDANFNGVCVEPNHRRLCRVIAGDLPSLTFRSYHPSYYCGFNNQLKEAIVGLLTIR